MVPSLGTASAAGTGLLLCLLQTGCTHPRGFIDDRPAMTDQASNSLFGAEEPNQSGEKIASAPASSLPAEVPRGDAVTPFVPSNQSCRLDAPGSPMTLGNMPQTVWGILDMRGFPIGQQMASNGVEYYPLFMLDLDFNIMLWREQRLYLFSDASFWGQKAGPGITNPSQGAFDFSKREFDFNVGAAWNYAGHWEARVFGYSFNNLNRGNSQISPSGFNDGLGLENRYYLDETYANLGTAAFDQARATFLSLGYYPTKSMVDGNGNQFRPAAFARAYLTCNLLSEQFYLYGDVQFVTEKPTLRPMLLCLDAGLAARPFNTIPRLEFRVGTLDMLNLQGGDLETSGYLAIRYVY